MDQDILYHLALGNESHDLIEMFGDIKVSWKKKNDNINQKSLIKGRISYHNFLFGVLKIKSPVYFLQEMREFIANEKVTAIN